jgi:hypothetical protein
MAISTTGGLLREAEAIVLAVITVEISLDGDIRDAITFHHLVIGMTLQADLGMKFPVFMGCCYAERPDLV